MSKIFKFLNNFDAVLPGTKTFSKIANRAMKLYNFILYSIFVTSRGYK